MQLRRPLVNNYLSDRLVAQVAEAISDSHMLVSQVRWRRSRGSPFPPVRQFSY